MKKLLIGVILIMTSITTVSATVYENGEDGAVSRWSISDGDLAGATVQNLFDADNGSSVIAFNGAGYANQYRIGNLPQQDAAWNDTQNRYFSWSIKNSTGFFVDVILETQNGLRYLRYSDDDFNHGIDGDIVNQGVGYSAADGNWHNYNRDLEADLKEFEPNNTILSVNGLEIRGNCSVDNIELKKDKPVVAVEKDFILYEDAEDGATNRWIISDNAVPGATVSNIFDNKKGSKVITLSNGASSYANQYQIGNFWNNPYNFNITWDMKTTEGFVIDVLVQSTEGIRYLRYTDNAENSKGKDGDTIYHGLGYYPTDGSWHTFSRDLEKDLKEFEPNNSVVMVDAFYIRANARLDNIELFSSPNKVYEDAEDGLTTGWMLYNGPSNATITNVYDGNKGSKVISFQGNGYENQYMLGGDIGEVGAWGDEKHSNLKWSMKNSGGYIIYVLTNTSNGTRYIKYSDDDFTQSGINSNVINYGLGYSTSNGEWHTFIRDIDADIKKFEAENSLLSIEGFLMIGSAEIDDLELFNIVHPVDYKAGMALTFDDYDVDGWYSMRDTFLDYGATATFFVRDFHTLTTAQVDKLTTLDQDGFEIGCHTYSHKGIGRDYHNDTSRITEYINEQIVPALNNMKAAGFNPTSLAYPYGEHEESYDAAVRIHFPYLRTTASDANRALSQLDEIYHKQGKSYNILAGDGIDNSYDNEIDEIRVALIKAREHGEIITLYAHEVLDNPNNPYAISAQKLEKIMEIAKEIGLEFYSFKDAYLKGN